MRPGIEILHIQTQPNTGYYFIPVLFKEKPFQRSSTMNTYEADKAAYKMYKSELLQQINSSGLPLVLFGYSLAIDLSFLKKVTVPVQYVCDNDPKKKGKPWGYEGKCLSIISPYDLPQIYDAYNVMILVAYGDEIIPQLNTLPVPPMKIFMMDFYFMKEDTADYYKSMDTSIQKVVDGLADSESRNVYVSLIRYRINRNPALLQKIVRPRREQYFPEMLGERRFLSESETFIDVGAYTGDTVIQFTKAVHGRYRSIFAYEPDPNNYISLRRNTDQLENVLCYQIGCSDMPRQSRLISGGAASKKDEFGPCVIQEDALDHLLKDTPVTYLKMDIEGMERFALRGAQTLIQRYRPKLAICTYHSDEDMILIPQLILSIEPTYQLYFRHYTNFVVDTVCYAI